MSAPHTDITRPGMRHIVDRPEPADAQVRRGAQAAAPARKPGRKSGCWAAASAASRSTQRCADSSSASSVSTLYDLPLIVELYDFAHQPFDQVLAKDAVLSRSQFGHCLRDGLDHSSISSTIMQWRQGRSCSFSGSAMTDFPLGPTINSPLVSRTAD